MIPKECDTYLNEATGRTRIFKNGQWADKTEPHQFQGSSDRWCEICNQPDRAAIHKIQPEEKPSLTPFDPSCSTCVREAREEAEEDAKTKTVPIKTHENLDAYAFYVEKVNDWQSTRIATLQEWLANDAKIIQQLNESNNLLSEKIAQLEKENRELTQRIDDYCHDYWKRLIAYRQTDASIRQYPDGSWHPAN